MLSLGRLPLLACLSAPLLVPTSPQATRQAQPSPLPTAAGQGSTASATLPASFGDEEGWRDDSKPALRAAWTKLEGKPAPSLSGLVDWSGTDARRWSDLHGQVVVLDFWATWCGPCLKEIPKLDALQRAQRDKGLTVLGLHAPRGRDKMAEFVRSKGLSYAFAADPDGKLLERFSVQFLPTYMVIDRRGVLRVAGASRAKVEEIVATLLAEPVPAADDLPPPTWPAIVEKELHADRDFRGKPAPELVFGDWLTAAPDLAGKAVLVDFWATWCPPCRKAIPDLNELHAAFSDDLVIVGLSGEERSVVEAFAKKTPMHYALACDPSGSLSGAVGVQGIPHALLISSDGVVRWQGFPLAETDPLTVELVGRTLDADPGVRARRKAREVARKQDEGESDAGGGRVVGMRGR